MNVLIHYRHFPMSIGRYIHWALENLGHSVMSAGSYSYGKIPWGDQYYYPQYKIPPLIVLPDVNEYPLEDVIWRLPVKPDLVIQAGDTQWLTGKSPVKNIIVATDPHVLDYHPRLTHADYFVSMQKYCLPQYEKGIWMPYGYDEYIHRELKRDNKYNVLESRTICS